MDTRDAERYMALALKLAARALEEDEVPVGAVIVASGSIIARAYNQVALLRDPTAHAEMLAITQAASALENERLTAATMFVTLEPCAMCTGALLQARIGRIVFGAADARAGACGSALDLPAHRSALHRMEVLGGVAADDAAALLRTFFASKRAPDRLGGAFE